MPTIISIRIGADIFSGSFIANNGGVTVWGAWGKKRMPLNGASPKRVARRLLRELVLEWNKAPD